VVRSFKNLEPARFCAQGWRQRLKGSQHYREGTSQIEARGGHPLNGRHATTAQCHILRAIMPEFSYRGAAGSNLRVFTCGASDEHENFRAAPQHA